MNAHTPTSSNKKLKRLVLAVFALGAIVSLTANILSAPPTITGRCIAAWPPVALIITVDLIARVPSTGKATSVIRAGVAASVGIIAGILSYDHMRALAETAGGMTGAAAAAVPWTVDGMIIAASLCLIDLARPTTAAGAGMGEDTQPTAASGGADEADSAHHLQGDRQADNAPTTGQDKAPAALADTAGYTPLPTSAHLHLVQPMEADNPQATTTGTEGQAPLPDRIRTLAAQHPDWTQTAIAAAAGCHPRTVRRHLPTPQDNTPETSPAPDSLEAHA